MDIILPMAI